MKNFESDSPEIKPTLDSPSGNSSSSWRPLVFALGWVSFFADVASEMLYPITPIFLSQTLGASMSSIGFIEGFAEAVANILKTKAGALSDRLGKRKAFVFAGYLISAIGKPMIGLATGWTGVLGARSLDRFGKGIRGAPRDAMIADKVPSANLGAAFGWHRGMDTAGAAVGPLIAIVYLHFYSQALRPLFYWSLLPGLCAALIILRIKESPRPASETKTSLLRTSSKGAPELQAATEKSSLRWNALDPRFKTYLLAWGLFSVANSSDVFLLMQAEHHGLSLIEVIGIYCFYNLVYAILSPVLGKWSDSIPRQRILISGLLVFALVYAGFAVAGEKWMFIVLFGVYGIYMAATDGVGKALAVDFLDSQNKGAGLGLFGSVTGFATMFASTTGGFLWDHWGASFCFWYGMIGALAGAIAMSAQNFFTSRK